MDSFFGIGLPELVVILIIAGIVMGPERIGVAARWLGRMTAQLQSISRSFVSQLNAEIDGVDGNNEIRGAVQDMQDLRSQIEQLKQELVSVTNGAVRDGQKAVKQTQDDLERIIAPPAIRDQKPDSPSQNEEPSSAEIVLPNRIEIADDPEQ